MPTTTQFDQLYAERRNELFGLLAVALGDANLAADAVDEGLSVAYRKRRSLPTDERLLACAFAAATEWAAKNNTTPADRGFRLDRSELDEGRPVLRKIEELPVGVRAALVLDVATPWPLEDRALALGLEPPQVERRVSRARQELDDHDGSEIEATVRSTAQSTRAPMSRPDFVKSRARRSSLRTIGAVALGAALVVGAVGAGIALTGGDEQVTAATRATSVTVVDDSTISIDGTTLALDDLSLTWSQSQFGSGNTDISSIVWADGQYVAVGRNFSGFGGDQAMIWTSVDGTAWTGQAANGIPRDSYLAALRPGTDGYFAIGVIYNQGPPQPVLWSSPDMIEWTMTPLEVPELELPDFAGQLDSYVDVTAVAAHGNTVVVGGGRHLEFDPTVLFRDQLPAGDHGFGWSTGGPGGGSVEVYGRDGQITFSATFEELGLPPEVIRFLDGPQLLVWSSSDGITFTPGVVPELNWVNALVAGPTGFVVAGGSADGPGGVYHSADGTTWAKSDLPGGANIQQLASSETGYLALESRGIGSVIWQSPNGAEWTELEAAPFNAWQLAVGPLGFIVAGTSTEGLPDPVPVTEEVDGYEVTVTFPESIIVRDLDGNLIAEYQFHELQYTSQNGSVLFDSETGEVLVRVPEGLIEESAAAFDRFGDTSDQGIWYSPSGKQWTRIDAPEIRGFSPHLMTVGSSSVLVAGWQEAGGFGPFGGGGGFVTWVGALAG